MVEGAGDQLALEGIQEKKWVTKGGQLFALEEVGRFKILTLKNHRYTRVAKKPRLGAAYATRLAHRVYRFVSLELF